MKYCSSLCHTISLKSSKNKSKLSGVNLIEKRKQESALDSFLPKVEKILNG